MSSFRFFLSVSPIFVLLTSCHSSLTLEDYTEESQGIIKSLIKELQNIHNRDQLNLKKKQLQILFEQLVDVMIAIEIFLNSQPEKEKNYQFFTNHELSDQLRYELNRVLSIDGARQIIEKTQENAIHRLEKFAH